MGSTASFLPGSILPGPTDPSKTVNRGNHQPCPGLPQTRSQGLLNQCMAESGQPRGTPEQGWNSPPPTTGVSITSYSQSLIPCTQTQSVPEMAILMQKNQDNLQMNHFEGPRGCEGRKEVEAVESQWSQHLQTDPTQALTCQVSPGPCSLTPTGQSQVGGHGERSLDVRAWKAGGGARHVATVSSGQAMARSRARLWTQDGTTSLPSLPAEGHSTESLD